jgi:vWA-MoxR associated protein C-terminal domain
VVRSLDRLRDRTLHDAWRRKWRWAAEHGHRPDTQAIYCLGSTGERDARAVYAQLVADDRVACLSLPFPPSEAEDAPGAEFAAALTAGIPVMVWARHPVDPIRFCGLVRDNLAAEGLRNVPRKTLRLRREAMRSTDSSSPSELPPAVGVLWEDADRMPGSFRQSIRLHAPLLGERE